jgi:hypothetical protein
METYITVRNLSVKKITKNGDTVTYIMFVFFCELILLVVYFYYLWCIEKYTGKIIRMHIQSSFCVLTSTHPNNLIQFHSQITFMAILCYQPKWNIPLTSCKGASFTPFLSILYFLDTFS